MVRHARLDGMMLADVAHLLPHAELGFVPFEASARKKEVILNDVRRVTLAVKPSLTTCLLDVHFTGEVDVDLAQESDRASEESGPFGYSAWRIGVELYLRPSRLLLEEWRSLDRVGIGFGALVGDEFALDALSPWEYRELEFGPRMFVDVTDWLTYLVAVNVLIDPDERRDDELFRLSAVMSVQLALPGHAIFGEGRNSH